MKIYYGDDGNNYIATERIAGGGSGSIFPILGDDSIVAKIFHKPEKQRDLRILMFCHLPWLEEIRRYVALPRTVLFEDAELTKQCGCIMEKLDCSLLLSETCFGKRSLSIRRRAIVGLELCKALQAIHNNGKKGSVLVGDFNFKNVVVDRITGSVKFINTDSFHLNIHTSDGRAMTLPCTELYPDFFPPEIMKLEKAYPGSTLEDLSNHGFQTFTLYTDYYCLAYNLHMLFLNCSPFSMGQTFVEMPNRYSLALNGNYCYSNLHSNTVLPKYCPDFNILTPTLQKLFIRAFQDGARQPELRPSPDEFIPALEDFIDNLNYCKCDGWNHYLHKSWKKDYCEWCRVDRETDSFRSIPSNEQDILYMTDQELQYLGHKQVDLENNPKALAYLLYEIACRHQGKGHNGTSEYSASTKEIHEHIKTAKSVAVNFAPELMPELEKLDM